MSNEQIVEQIQNGIDVVYHQEQMWMKNRRFVLRIIKQYCGFTDDLEDLEQQGFLGLVTAAMKYRPEKGVKFITYSAYWIRQSIFRYHENCAGSVRVPAYMKTNIRKYERFRNEFRNANGRYPDEIELCGELKLSARSLANLERTVHDMRSISLDSPTAGTDTDITFLEYIQSDEDMEDAVTYSIYQRELHEELGRALQLLDNVTRGMIYSVYFQGNSRSRTAYLFGCSKQNVNERIGKGFSRILHSQYRETLEAFMGEGYRYNEYAYSGYAELDGEENKFLI